MIAMTAPQAKVYALDESDDLQVSLSRHQQLTFAFQVWRHPIWKDHCDEDEDGATRNYRIIGFEEDTDNIQLKRCMLDADDQVVEDSDSVVSVSRYMEILDKRGLLDAKNLLPQLSLDNNQQKQVSGVWTSPGVPPRGKRQEEIICMRWWKFLLAIVAFFLSIGTFSRLTLMENDTEVPNGMFVAEDHLWYPDPNKREYNDDLSIRVEFGFHKGYKRLIRRYYDDDKYERESRTTNDDYRNRKLRDYMSELYERENEAPYDGSLTYASGPTEIGDLRESGTFYYKDCMTDDYNITIHQFNNLTVTSSICQACYEAGNDASEYFWLSSASVFLYIVLLLVAPSFECYNIYEFPNMIETGNLYDKGSIYYRDEATKRIRTKIMGVVKLLCIICLDVACMLCLVLGYVNFQRCRDAVTSEKQIGAIRYDVYDSIGIEATRAVMAFVGLNSLFDFITVCIFLLQRIKNSPWTNKQSGILHLQRLSLLSPSFSCFLCTLLIPSNFIVDSIIYILIHLLCRRPVVSPAESEDNVCEGCDSCLIRIDWYRFITNNTATVSTMDSADDAVIYSRDDDDDDDETISRRRRR